MYKKGFRNELSRRDFLKGTAVGIGAVGLAGIGVKEAKAIPLDKVRKWDFTADVVIVGYGAAGGNAAIAAKDAGAKPLIIEKMPFAGGNSGVSAGAMLLPNTVPEAIDYYRTLSFGTAEEDMIRAFAEAIVGLPELLKELGAEFTIMKYHAQFPTVLRSEIRAILFNPTGPGGLKFLAEAVEKRGIKAMFKTSAKNLIQVPETREVVGVKAEGGGKEIYIKAERAVVLACGGYEYNPEMLGYYNFPGATPFIFPWGTPGNTGDGFKLALGAGAYPWHMASYEWGCYCAKVPSKEFGMAIGFGFGWATPAGSFIFVNKYGKRFMRETKSALHRKEPLEILYFDHENAEYPNLPSYMIFDEIYKKKGPIACTLKFFEKIFGGPVGYPMVHKIYEWSEANDVEIEKGWIIKADTIKELAGKIKVDPQGLEETVSKIKNYYEAGKDLEFGRSKASLEPIETPPYYAIEMALSLINTQGGPKHNPQAQVLDFDNKPIPRLYAAGENGSFVGFLYQGGNNYPEAWAFGRIAGKNAAAEKPFKVPKKK
jgi:succinate dehydrogenase/fumarate reductase flavoprotein subunit